MLPENPNLCDEQYVICYCAVCGDEFAVMGEDWTDDSDDFCPDHEGWKRHPDTDEWYDPFEENDEGEE